MSKKLGKYTNGHATAKWEHGLAREQLHEPGWKVFIALIVENKPEDVINVNNLTSAINSGSRRRFGIITQQSLYKEVNVFGNPKGRSKDTPQYVEVCEACKAFLDSKEPIPSELLAKLIKFKLLSLKSDDICKSKPVEKRKASLQSVDLKKVKTGKGAKAAGKKTAAAKPVEEGSIKEGTHLKKRSEEIYDYKYIDDEPEFGPNYYAVISGFYEPSLPILLADIDILIDVVVKFGSTHYTGLAIEVINKDNLIPKDSRLIAQEEAAAAETERLKKAMDYFWKWTMVYLNEQSATSQTRNIYVTDFLDDKESNLENDGAKLYEKFAFTLYGIVEKQRMYRNFIRNTKIIAVPTIGTIPPRIIPFSSNLCIMPPPPQYPLIEPRMLDTLDMRYYDDLMDTIPMECVTIPLVLHAMIEQVVAIERHTLPPREYQPPPTIDGLNQDLAKHLSMVLQKLILDDNCSEVIDDKLEEKEVPKEEPLRLISYKDESSKLFHHLKPFHDFVPSTVVDKMLDKFCFCRIENFPDTALRHIVEAEAREFLHFCSKDGVSYKMVNFVLQQSVFQTLQLPHVDKEGLLQPYAPTNNNAWDHPIFLLEQTVFPEYEGVEFSNKLLQNTSSTISLDSALAASLVTNEKPTLYRRHSSVDERSLDWFGSKNVSPDIERICKNLMEKIKASRQRNLEKWNYLEHLSSSVFHQVLFEAMYFQPHYTKYYHIREDSLYLILDNPYNTELFNLQTWHVQLYSNIGFRNFMFYVADEIKEWSLEEDKKELEQLREEKALRLLEQQTVVSEYFKVDRIENRHSLDDKKVLKKKELVSNVNSEQSKSIFDEDQFTRPHSLKASKKEEHLLKVDDFDKEKKKRKSPPRQDKSPDKEKRIMSRCSIKTPRIGRFKSMYDDSLYDMHASQIEQDADRPELPFSGYKLDDNLIKLTSKCYTMFPCDGSQIRVTTENFLTGAKNVRCSVLLNGHVFSVHILNPIESDALETECLPPATFRNPVTTSASSLQPQTNKPIIITSPSTGAVDTQETETKMPIFSEFGSFTATLADGVVLAYSQFGPTGYFRNFSGNIDQTSSMKDIKDQLFMSSESFFKERSRKRSRFSMDRFQSSDMVIGFSKKCGSETDAQFGSFPTLYLTCPDGLKIDYDVLHSKVNNDDYLIVRQSFPFNSKGLQTCELVRNEHSYLEERRTVLPNGTVIKKMKNGKYHVLHADGTVAHGEFASDKQIMHTTEKSDIADLNIVSLTCEIEKLDLKTMKWTVIQSNGQKVILYPGGKKEYLPKVLFSMKSDVKSGQTMMTRDDNVILISEPSGKTTVEHQDGTRITSYFEKVYMSENCKASYSNYENITMAMFAMVECPSYATIKFNIKTQENHTMIGNGTIINVFSNGFLRMLFGSSLTSEMLKLGLDGSFIYTNVIGENQQSKCNPPIESTYYFKHNSNIICETTDVKGNTFYVNYKGEKEIVKEARENNDDNKFREGIQHSPRYFILHRDGCVDELLNKNVVDDFVEDTEQQPTATVLKDIFQDNSGMSGITYLKPIQKNASDNWVVEYECNTIIPPGFLENSETLCNVKSTDHQIKKCPNLLETRQFTQYEDLDKDLQRRVHRGLYNYIYYKFQRHFQLENLTVFDTRKAEEEAKAKSIEAYVQQLPELHSQHIMNNDNVKKMYENAMNQGQTIVEVESVFNEPPVEKEKSQNYCYDESIRKALRNKTIPNYFESVFGKTFLANQEEEKLDEELKNHCIFNGIAEEPEEEDSSLTVTSDIAEAETPQGLRPINPSPAHASGNASPTSVRPTNPTPHISNVPFTDRPSSLTGDEAPQLKQLAEITRPNLFQRHSEPLALALEIPGNTILPKLFISTPTTHSPDMINEMSCTDRLINGRLAGSSLQEKDRMKLTKSLELSVNEIQFGKVRVGQTYEKSFFLRNTGVDSCRFKIKQPPPSSGLKILYRLGPIAAGLQEKLTVKLHIPAPLADKYEGGISLKYDLCIVTEKTSLVLQILAAAVLQRGYTLTKNLMSPVK
eukprot:XP_014768400.1 PREDICTED: sperm-associated antigen 17-like isoform X1 [Octopus bimaculoides]